MVVTCHWPAHSLDVREAEVDLTRGPGRGVTRELGLGDQAGLLQRLHHSFCLKRIFFWFNLEIVFESVFSILQILKQLTQWQMQNIQKYKLKTRHCTNLAHMTQTLWKKSPRAPAKILGFETLLYDFYSMKHSVSCNFSQTCVHLNLKHDFKFWAVFMLSLLFRQLSQAHQVSSLKSKCKCKGPQVTQRPSSF